MFLASRFPLREGEEEGGADNDTTENRVEMDICSVSKIRYNSDSSILGKLTLLKDLDELRHVSETFPKHGNH